MKSKFGVITFTPEQITSEGIVLREPNFTRLENRLKESKKKIELGSKLVIGFLVTSVTVLAAGLFLRQAKLIPVKTTKRFLK